MMHLRAFTIQWWRCMSIYFSVLCEF